MAAGRNSAGGSDTTLSFLCSGVQPRHLVEDRRHLKYLLAQRLSSAVLVPPQSRRAMARSSFRPGFFAEVLNRRHSSLSMFCSLPSRPSRRNVAGCRSARRRRCSGEVVTSPLWSPLTASIGGCTAGFTVCQETRLFTCARYRQESLELQECTAIGFVRASRARGLLHGVPTHVLSLLFVEGRKARKVTSSVPGTDLLTLLTRNTVEASAGCRSRS